MAPPLLTLQEIELTFGGTPLFEGAEFTVAERDRLCLVGRNGSGKSTLLKIAAGLVEPDSGKRFIKPGVTMRYLEQEPDLSSYASVFDYAVSDLGSEGDEYRVTQLLSELGLDGSLPTDNLSGGEARRAAIVRALAAEPDILMLDEPTNHLDLPAIEWLEKELSGLRSALVIISHDRRFLSNLSNRVVWIDRGFTRELDQGFSEFEAWRDDLLEQEETDRHKLDRKLVRENHWLVHGVSGRRKRNQKRLSDLYGLREERQKMAERSRRASQNVSMTVVEAQNSGKLVVEMKGVSKVWDGPPIISDLSLKITRKDRIGIVGPNGSGKTTLLKLITGDYEPDAGSIRRGTQLELITLDQKRDELTPATTLKDALTGGGSDQVAIGDKTRHVIGYMKDFLFTPEQANTPIERLSGGERGRLMLARAFARPSNMLVLDEPTNDLDLETLDLLQELLSDYSGTVLLVSHDRDFIDRVVTSVVVSEGDGQWTSYAGGYTDMRAQQGSSAKAEKKARRGKDKNRSSEQSAEVKNTGGAGGKLSYKDKFALEQLPIEMAALQSKIEGFKNKLDEADFFSRDPDGFQKVIDGLAQAETSLEDCEERWLELEELREAVEGS